MIYKAVSVVLNALFNRISDTKVLSLFQHQSVTTLVSAIQAFLNLL